MKPLPANKAVSYRQLYIKCGKSPCRTCESGQGHGPYWYYFYYDHGRTRTGYVGKTLPGKQEGQKR